MELSNGGTEWLLFWNDPLFTGPSFAFLHSMNPATLAMTAVGATPFGQHPILAPIPSASFNKAYLVTGSAACQLVPVATDPATSVPAPTPLPILAQAALRVLVD